MGSLRGSPQKEEKATSITSEQISINGKCYVLFDGPLAPRDRSIEYIPLSEINFNNIGTHKSERKSSPREDDKGASFLVDCALFFDDIVSTLGTLNPPERTQLCNNYFAEHSTSDPLHKNIEYFLKSASKQENYNSSVICFEHPEKGFVFHVSGVLPQDKDITKFELTVKEFCEFVNNIKPLIEKQVAKRNLQDLASTTEESLALANPALGATPRTSAISATP